MRADTYTFTLVENQDGSRHAILMGPGCAQSLVYYGDWPAELLVAAHSINRERHHQLTIEENITARIPACGGPTLVDEVQMKVQS